MNLKELAADVQTNGYDDKRLYPRLSELLSVSKIAATLSPTQRAAVLAEYRRQSGRVHNAAGWLRSAFVGGWAGNVSEGSGRGHVSGYNGGSNNNNDGPIASAAAYLTIPIPPPLPVGLPAAAGLSPRERLALVMGNSVVMGNSTVMGQGNAG